MTAFRCFETIMLVEAGKEREAAVLYSGIFDLAGWVYAAIALALTHVTIIAVTIFLHRH